MANHEPAAYIPVLVGSSRVGRRSIHVARFVIGGFQGKSGAFADLVDLAEYNFPVMQRRASETGDMVPRLREFCRLMGQADGVLIVTPEYNSSSTVVS